MAIRITPRRVIPVDDAGTVVRLPVSPRRTSSPPPARTALTAVRRAVPVGMRQVGRNDPDYLGISPGSAVRNPAARGNYVSTSEAVRAVQFPESNNAATRKYYRMGASEREMLSTVASVGGDKRFLFSGQRGVWEHADQDRESQDRRHANNPDGFSWHSEQQAVWEDDDVSPNVKSTGIKKQLVAGIDPPLCCTDFMMEVNLLLGWNLFVCRDCGGHEDPNAPLLVPPYDPATGMTIPPEDWNDWMNDIFGSRANAVLPEPCDGVAIATFMSLGPSTVYWLFSSGDMSDPRTAADPCDRGQTCANTASMYYPSYQVTAVFVEGAEITGLQIRCTSLTWINP